MKIVCPNKNLPEWKQLSEILGEDRAMLAFIRNNDDIPNIEQAYGLLGEEVPIGVDNPALRDVDSTAKALEDTSEEYFKKLIKIVNNGKQGTIRDGGRRKKIISITPLKDSPTVPGVNGPDPQIVRIAEEYARKNGIKLKRQGEYVKVDEGRAKRIAKAYSEMKHDPKNERVKEAYDNLINQTIAQYEELVNNGYVFWFMDLNIESNLQYSSSPYNALRDLRQNKQMGVFPTTDGFGTLDLDTEDNPLLKETRFKWPVGGVNGQMKPVLANDLFRAVHDVFGHNLEGAGFRGRGEENAWQAHVRLYKGSAVAAITSETRGQNSWLNYNEQLLKDVVGEDLAKEMQPKSWDTITVGESNRSAKVEDTIFADQKTGLLPDWVWKEGLAEDMEPSTEEIISQAYHKAKKDGSNLELVKAVEDSLTNSQTPASKMQFQILGQKETEDVAREDQIVIIDSFDNLANSIRQGQVSMGGNLTADEIKIATQEIINRLEQTGLASEVFQLDNQGMLDKLKELGVSDDIALQIVEQLSNPYYEVINGFYSPLEKIITESKFDKLPAKQWLDKFGKGDEAKWTGLTEWLSQQQGSVSKADIQQFLKDNRIEIVEIVKGEDMPNYKLGAEPPSELGANRIDLLGDLGKAGNLDNPRFREYLNKKYGKNGNKIYDWLAENATVEGNYSKDTKYSQYQLEGEKENYKEVLVTMPSKGVRPIGKWEFYEREGYTKEEFEQAPREFQQKLFDKWKEATSLQVVNKSQQFKSSHFDEPNILVHLRMNTRTDAEGKKVLFLEEVQSDWGQKGKKEGFGTPKYTTKDVIIESNGLVKIGNDNNSRNYFIRQRRNEFVVESTSGITVTKFDNIEKAKEYVVDKENSRQEQLNHGVPSAPFVTDTNAWTKLALKVALKEAVKQDADKIAWTTGEQQNERYDLSKQVDVVDAKRNKDGSYEVEATKDGSKIFGKSDMSLREIEDTFGKDVAQKINDSKSPLINISGDNLKAGGKGMKGFYGSPTEGSLGIVGNVAKSLFKQEPKTVEIDIAPQNLKEIYTSEGAGVILNDKSISERVQGIVLSGLGYFEVGQIADIKKGFKLLNETVWDNRYTEKEIEEGVKYAEDYVNKKPKTSTQYSIDITPELKAQVEQGLPLFQKQLQDKGITLTPKGFVYKRQVFLNTEAMTPDTPVHEFQHLHFKWLKNNRPAVYQKGIDLVKEELNKKDSEIKDVIEYVKTTQPNLKGEKLHEEILTELAGRRGVELILNNKTPKKGGIIEWLKSVFDQFKNLLGLKDMTDEEVMKMTLSEFVEKANIDLLKGEPIKGSEAQEYFTRNADRLPLTLSVFSRPEFVKLQGKEVNPITVLNSLNQTGIKQIEKDLIKKVIEDNYAGQKKISYDELEATVRANIMPLERIFTSSYADYGMNKLGNGDYGNANTIILNAPIEHGVTGHFSRDFKASGRKNIKYIPKQLNDNTWVAVEEGFETQGANENNIYQFVGTAGTKESVDAWIANYENPTKAEKEYIAYTRMLETKYNNGRISKVATEEEKAELERLRTAITTGDINKGMFGHIRVWQDGDVFNVAELQSDYFQNNSARKGILEQKEDYKEVVKDKTNKIDSFKKRQKDTFLKLKKLGYRFITGIKGGKTQTEVYIPKNEYGLPLGDRTGVKVIEKDKYFYIDNNGVLLSNIYISKNIAERDLEIYANNEYFNFDIEPLSKEDVPSDLQSDFEFLTVDFHKKIANIEKEFNNKVEEIISKLSPQEKQFIASQKEWEKRMVREAIKEASLSGATELRFPAPYTLSVIEGYIKPSEGTEDKIFNYSGDIDNPKVGDTLNYLDDKYTVIDIRENGSVDIATSVIKMSLIEAKDKIGRYVERDNSVPKEEKNNETLNRFNYLKLEGAQNLEPGVGLFLSGENVLQTTTYSIIENIVLKQKEVTNENFSIEKDLSPSQQTVAYKYQEIAEILKQERGDNFETIKDKNGFDWYSTKIQPSEVNRPVTAFQKTAGITIEEAIKRNNGNPLNLAPNGKPSILYQSYKDLGYSDSEAERLTAQVYSDSFREWFEGSKVIDANGQPLLTFHQTKEVWDKFDKSKVKAGKFDFETPTGIFTKSNKKDIGLGSIQMPLFINLKNPLYFRNRSSASSYYELSVNGYSEIVEQIKRNDIEYNKKVDEETKKKEEELNKLRQSVKYEIPSPEWSKIVRENSKTVDDILDEWTQQNDILSEKAKALIDKHIEKSEYDGVLLLSDKGSWGRETDAFIAINPNQIKSATENIGTFSNESNDIRFQKAPVQDPTKKLKDTTKAIEESIEQDKEAILGEKSEAKRKELIADINKRREIIGLLKNIDTKDDNKKASANILADGTKLLITLKSNQPQSFIQKEFFDSFVLESMTDADRQVFIDEYNSLFEDSAEDFNDDVSNYTNKVYERYMSSGRVLTDNDVKDESRRQKLQNAFNKFTEFVKKFYNNIIEYNNSKGTKKKIELSDNAKAFFDRISGISGAVDARNSYVSSGSDGTIFLNNYTLTGRKVPSTFSKKDGKWFAQTKKKDGTLTAPREVNKTYYKELNDQIGKDNSEVLLEALGNTPEEITEQIYKFFTSRIPKITDKRARQLAQINFDLFKIIADRKGFTDAVAYANKLFYRIGMFPNIQAAREYGVEMAAQDMLESSDVVDLDTVAEGIVNNAIEHLKEINKKILTASNKETNQKKRLGYLKEVEDNKKLIDFMTEARANARFSSDKEYRGIILMFANSLSIVASLESPRSTTFAHEAMFHGLMEPLMDNEERRIFVDAYNQQFNENVEDYNRDVSEFAAVAWESYLTKGKKIGAKEVPNLKLRQRLQKIFDGFLETLQEFLTVTNTAGKTQVVKITPEVQKFFDKILGIDEQVQGNRNTTSEQLSVVGTDTTITGTESATPGSVKGDTEQGTEAMQEELRDTDPVQVLDQAAEEILTRLVRNTLSLTDSQKELLAAELDTTVKDLDRRIAEKAAEDIKQNGLKLSNGVSLFERIKDWIKKSILNIAMASAIVFGSYSFLKTFDNTGTIKVEEAVAVRNRLGDLSIEYLSEQVDIIEYKKENPEDYPDRITNMTRELIYLINNVTGGYLNPEQEEFLNNMALEDNPDARDVYDELIRLNIFKESADVYPGAVVLYQDTNGSYKLGLVRYYDEDTKEMEVITENSVVYVTNQFGVAVPATDNPTKDNPSGMGIFGFLGLSGLFGRRKRKDESLPSDILNDINNHKELKEKIGQKKLERGDKPVGQFAQRVFATMGEKSAAKSLATEIINKISDEDIEKSAEDAFNKAVLSIEKLDTPLVSVIKEIFDQVDLLNIDGTIRDDKGNIKDLGTGHQFITLGKLANKYKYDTDKYNTILVYTNLAAGNIGRLFRTLRTDIIGKYIDIVSVAKLKAKVTADLDKNSYDGVPNRDAVNHVRVIINLNGEKITSSEALEKAISSIRTEFKKEENIAKYKEIEVIFKSAKASGPLLNQAAVDLAIISLNETGGSYREAKKLFIKKAELLGIADPEKTWNVLSADPRVAQAMGDSLTKELEDRLSKLGTKPSKNTTDILTKFVQVLNKKPGASKKSLVERLKDNEIKKQEIENAILAASTAISDPVLRAEAVRALEDKLSYLTNKSIGGAEFRKLRQENSVKELLKGLIDRRLSLDFVNTTIAEDLISEFGLDPNDSKLIEQEVKKLINKHIDSLGSKDKDRAYLASLGLDEESIKSEIKKYEDKIANERSKSLRDSYEKTLKALNKKLKDLPRATKSALNKKKNFGNFIDILKSGQLTNSDILSAFTHKYNISNLTSDEIAEVSNYAFLITNPNSTPTQVKEATDKLASFLKRKTLSVGALDLINSIAYDNMLSGPNTGITAFISSVVSSLKLVAEDLMQDVYDDLLNAFTKKDFSFSKIKDFWEAIEFVYTLAPPVSSAKVLALIKGHSFSTDSTFEDVKNMETIIDPIQAYYQNKFKAKFEGGPFEYLTTALSKALAAAQLTIHMAGKLPSIGDASIKPATFFYELSRERKEEEDVDLNSIKGASQKAFLERYKQLLKESQEEGDDQYTISAAIEASKEIEEYFQRTAVEAAKINADFISVSGSFRGYTTPLFVNIERAKKYLSRRNQESNDIDDNLLKYWQKTWTSFLSLPLTLTSPFSRVTNLMIQIGKNYSVFGAIGSRVVEVGKHKVVVPAPLAVNTSVVYNPDTNSFEDVIYTDRQVRKKMRALILAASIQALNLLLFEKTPCKSQSEDPNKDVDNKEPGDCFKPRFENFRYTGNAKEYDDPTQNYPPHTFQYRNKKGEWKNYISVDYFPPLVALFAPMGNLFDRYHLGEKENKNKAVSLDNIGESAMFIADLLTSPITSMDDVGFVRDLFNIYGTVATFVTDLTKANVNTQDELESAGLRKRMAVAKSLSRSLSTFVPGNANLFKQGYTIYMDNIANQPKTVSENVVKTKSPTANVFFNSTFDNTIYGKLILNQESLTNSLGLETTLTSNNLLQKMISYLAGTAPKDERPFNSENQNKLWDHSLKLGVFTSPINAIPLLMAEAKSKTSGDVIPVFTGITEDLNSKVLNRSRLDEGEPIIIGGKEVDYYTFDRKISDGTGKISVVFKDNSDAKDYFINKKSEVVDENGKKVDFEFNKKGKESAANVLKVNRLVTKFLESNVDDYLQIDDPGLMTYHTDKVREMAFKVYEGNEIKKRIEDILLAQYKLTPDKLSNIVDSAGKIEFPDKKIPENPLDADKELGEEWEYYDKTDMVKWMKKNKLQIKNGKLFINVSAYEEKLLEEYDDSKK